MESEIYEHHRSGRDQTLCAWGIVLVLALLFGGLELVWPRMAPKTSGFDVATVQATLSWKRPKETE